MKILSTFFLVIAILSVLAAVVPAFQVMDLPNQSTKLVAFSVMGGLLFNAWLFWGLSEAVKDLDKYINRK